MKKSESKSSPKSIKSGSKKDPAAIWHSFDALKPWKKNPRKNERGVSRIARSLRRFGWGRPFLARRDGEIIAGHTTRLAVISLFQEFLRAPEEERSNPKSWHPDIARSMRTREVPVRFVDLSEEAAHELAIADNRLQEFSEWDDDELAEQLEGLDQEARDAIGYFEKEYRKFLDSHDPPRAPNVEIDQSFQVVLIVETEREQIEIIEWAQKKGYKCRAIV